MSLFNKKIYLDYASLTPIDKGVLKMVKKYSSKEYANPSSIYSSGVKAEKAIEDAKVRIAKILHAHPDEIVFTSGGTESNNLILQNFQDRQIIISSIEHSSIINSARSEKNNIIHIPVDKNGFVDLEYLKKSITAETSLVSIMMVNNEIGTIEPIHEIAKIVRDANKRFGTKILFHTDACQTPIHLPIHVEKLGADMISLDGNKIYGPRGVGMLYIKRVNENSEKKITRTGTENVPGIMGFAYALELADKMREKENMRISELKNFFLNELIKINSNIKINGNLENSVPNILNISIPGIDNEFFVLQLDVQRVECSTKSACLVDEDESYVLKAMGADSKTSVRFSFGRQTSKGDLKKVLKIIRKVL